MKKQVLLFTVLLMGLTAVTATENRSGIQDEDLMTRYRYAQPVMFVERGVEFMIFPDGSFDFNTQPVNSPNTNQNYYYRSSTSTSTVTRRSSVNITFGAPGIRHAVSYSAPRDRGVLIQHDRDGKVRRIGNVFINYDREGRIKRAGSVYMRYNNRSGFLQQVGGLHVSYNRFGELIQSFGFVNPFSTMCAVCGDMSCTVNHYSGFQSQTTHWDHNQDQNPDDFYYYRTEQEHETNKEDKS